MGSNELKRFSFCRKRLHALPKSHSDTHQCIMGIACVNVFYTRAMNQTTKVKTQLFQDSWIIVYRTEF